MVKNEALSSDLNLVRELEQLKIKQKLLIESLSKKNKSAELTLMQDINRKLDFLVQIFKEATNDEHEKEQNAKLDQISEQLSTSLAGIEEKFNARLDEMQAHIKSNFEEMSEKMEEMSFTPQNKKLDIESQTPPPKPPMPQDDVKDLDSLDKGKKGWFKK